MAAASRTVEVLVCCARERMNDLEIAHGRGSSEGAVEGPDTQGLPETRRFDPLDGHRRRAIGFPREDGHVEPDRVKLVGNVPRHILDATSVGGKAFDHEGDAQRSLSLGLGGNKRRTGYRLQSLSSPKVERNRIIDSQAMMDWRERRDLRRICISQPRGNSTRSIRWMLTLSMPQTTKLSSTESKPSKPEGSIDRSRQGSDKRKKILESAIRVFADKGYHGTRISDIARDAEIAYGLVYHYFRNKEDILDAIFLERWGGFIETVEAVTREEKPLEEKLFALAELILSSDPEQSKWLKVLIFEIQRTQRFSDPDRMRIISQLFFAISRVLRDAQAKGELRKEIDPDIACYIFIGGIDIVVTSRVLELIPVEKDEKAHYTKVARTVVDLFLHGMKS